MIWRRRGRAGWRLLLGLAAAGLGCASSPDPLEPMNRGIFRFNEGVDRYVVEPVATGWDEVVPETAQTGVRNFFANLRMPVVFVNDLLQAKPLAAGEDVARFVINTTVGVVGLLDVASHFGVPENDEDFDQTLGRYGLPPGPYLVLPLLGPSSPRGVVGLVADGAATPHNYFVPVAVNAGVRTVELVNLRAYFLEEVRQNRAEALDYYVFVRNAYRENREHRVQDREDTSPEAGAEVEEDLYYIEEEEGE